MLLLLQKRLPASYYHGTDDGRRAQIVIYGKIGHAEVNGLVGQTNGEAIVVEGLDSLDKIDFSRNVYLYSQTTKSLQGFKAMCDEIAKRKNGEGFECYDTICRSVANRIPNIREFASRHDLILFVCGSKSSNGRILFAECHTANPESYLISNADEINPEWLRGKESIGICGATSTPMWLMHRVKEAVENQL